MYQTSSSFFSSQSRLFFFLLVSLWFETNTARSQTVLTVTAPTASQTGTTGRYTVPSGGPYKYRITAKGARGGNSGSFTGGQGATLIGEFSMLSGQTINAIAGAAGGDITGDETAGGGGGGSGVQLSNGPAFLIAAGGGGGISRFAGTGTVGGNGLATNSGSQGGNGTIGGAGGGGFLSNGGAGGGGATGGGKGFGGLGGSNGTTGGRNGGGGFGGGGGGQGGSIYRGGGGGGGYTGGNGNGNGNGGNGGGSINYGTNQNNTAGNNNAEGQVLVELIGPAAAFAPNITATQPACGSTTGSVTIDMTGDFNNSTNSVEYAIVAGSSFSGTPSFTTISSEPLSVTSGTGTLATAGGSTYTVRVRLIYNPAIYTDYTYTLTLKPTRLYVKAGASGANTGLNWTDAFNDLQSALNYPNTQCLTEIWVAAGTYKPTTSTTDKSARFSMKNGVAIYGGFVGTEANLSERPVINPVNGQPSSTTLSGDINNDGTLNGNSSNVITNSGLDATAILNGFVIEGGNSAAFSGGAMYNTSSNPVLTNCSFIGNSVATSGGAMYNFGSSPVLTNCSFIGNSAFSVGGAMCNFSNSNPVLTNCSFIGNSAFSGGAIYNTSSNPVLTNCSFQSNFASKGGAMYNFSSSNPTLINCSFRANSASEEGGAIDYQGSTATLINCGFLNNQSAGSGGAIFSYNSTLQVINGSWQNNTASSGGAINTFNGVFTLTNCVAFGNGGNNTFTNTVNNGQPSGFTATYSLFEPTSVTVTGMNVSGPGNLTTTSSPFASTTTIALNQCAPAINVGSNAAYSSASGPTTDLNGQPRNYNSVIDMGAIEYQGLAGAVSLSNPTVSSAPVGSPFSQSFTASGGSSSYNFSLVSGNLPPSLSLSSTGVLSGTPTQAGSYSMTVQATNATGCVAQSGLYTLTIFSPIRYVKSGASGSGNSWADASGDLQSQINVSSAQQVWVATGLYKPSTTDREASFSMKNGVAIYGGFTGTEANLTDRQLSYPSSTTLSGDIDNDGALTGNSYHVIKNSGGMTTTALLNGFVVTGGNADGTGSSVSFGGGGMLNVNTSSPTVSNCLFTGNYASIFGGAIFNQSSSSPVLINCGFLNNRSDRSGGAITNNGVNTVLINCSFQGNLAVSSGQAIYNYTPCTVSLMNCVLWNNSTGNAITNFATATTIISYSLFASGDFLDGPGNLSSTSSPFASTATLALNPCALAINTGSNDAYTSANGPTTDLSGQARNYNSSVIDMGAVEYQGLAGAVSLSNPTVSTASVGSPFSQSFSASGGSSPYSFSLVSGSLPSSLSLSSTGVLAGTPTQGGSYSITVQAINATGCVAQSGVYTLTVNSPLIRYVKSGASGSGSSWVDASGDLQGQINFSGVQQVWVATGTYKPSTTNQGARFSMKNGVAIYGGFVGTEANLSERPVINPVNGQPSSTTLSGDIDNDGTLNGNSDNVIVNDDINGTAILNGFVITGGNAPIGGGAMYNRRSSPTLTNCSFIGNSASLVGGAMENEGSSPVLTNCSFQSNTSKRGGAMYNVINSGQTVSNPTLINCSFRANTASEEGGAVNYQTSTATLINCAFLNNQSAGNGGAIFNYGSTLKLINCSWQNNTASAGGAVLTFNGVVTLTNCVAFGNGDNNTFTNQVNNTDPSGFTATYSLFEPTSVTVSGMNVSGPGNLTTTSSPFASTASVAMNGCSPAINAGSNDAYTSANGPTTDLSGQARNYNGSTIDMGAIDYQGAPSLQTGFTAQPVASSVVCVGATVTASVSVSGTGPFTYQWYKGSSVVNDQISATLSLTNVQTSEAGSYSVVVTGACNSLTSSAFNLTVTAIPTVIITANPALTITQGGSTTLTASGATSYSWASGETTAAISVSGAGSYSVTGTSSGCSSSTSVVVTMTSPTPTLAGFAVNPTSVCVGSPVTFTASVGNVSGSYSFTLTNGSSTTSGSSANPTFSQGWLANGSGPQTFTLTLTSSGQTTAATTTLTVNTTPSVSINPTSATLTSASPTVSLTAIGSGTYLWSTGETSQVISVTSSGVYSVTLTTPGGCTASASAAVPGTDLSVTLELPQAQFGASGTAAIGNFVVNVFEVGGLPTSSGNVTITITAPAGYSLSFASSLTSIDVSGGSRVDVNNGVWTVSHSIEDRQLSLTMNSGVFIGAGSKLSLGLSLTRTTANSGSTANITVNVADDLTMTYDGNLTNNIYARIISGL